MRTNLTSDACRKFFNEKLCFCGKHCDFLDYFLGTKMTILMCGWSKLLQNKSNSNVYLLFSKVDNIQKPCLSLKSGFLVSLLVCEFNPPRQTWYQKFIGTYSSLTDSKHHKPFLHNKILSFSGAWNAYLLYNTDKACEASCLLVIIMIRETSAHSKFGLAWNLCR